MTKYAYLVVGGPLDGQHRTREDVRGHEYTSYNCSSKQTMMARGPAGLRRVPKYSSMIWVHKSLSEISKVTVKENGHGD